MSRLKIQLLAGLLVSVVVSALYLLVPHEYHSLDNRLRDYMFLLRGEIPTTDNVVIIDIDERSIKELGQWPWERNKVAAILQNLADAGAGVVGLDIVFAEPDNSSPAKIVQELGLELEVEVEDYDYTLAATIANTPTIPGYIFIMQEDDLEPLDGPSIPAIFIERGKPDEVEYLSRPYRPVLNIPLIQDNAYSSGFFNTIPDASGMIRSVPLAMKYEGVVYPSLSMEMIRIASQANRVTVNYDPEIGVQSIQSGDVEVPTDRFGRIFVNFRGPSHTFPYLSAVDIYKGDFNPEEVAGKFLLVGTSAAGLLDLRAMPFDSVYPGVEIHANVIDNILAGDYISSPSWVIGLDLFIIFIVGILFSLVLAYTGALTSLLAALIFAGGLGYLNYYMLFSEGIAFNIFFTIVLMVFLNYTIANVINYFLETRQKEFIKAKFANKVSPAVVDDILKNPSGDILEGKDREVTIFFSDVRGFTSISEAMGSPKRLIDFLNEYMTPMTDIVVSYHGTVDKFIGDAIMAFWNAPNDVANHADAALKASIDQIKALGPLNERLVAEGKPEIHIGIGLNTGIATVGEMGSAMRSDYTIIGDAVNLASRLEGLNKPYGSQIIISEFTKAQLTGEYIIRDLDLVRVKGKEEPVQIFEVLDYGVATGELANEFARYEEALANYRKGSFESALEQFKTLRSKSDHELYHMYIDRCEHYLEHPPEGFDGVFTFTTK